MLLRVFSSVVDFSYFGSASTLNQQISKKQMSPATLDRRGWLDFGENFHYDETMPTGPYTAEQMCFDFLRTSLPWFVLAAILNRWIFERVRSSSGKYLLMPVSMLLNIAISAGVIVPYVDSSSNEMAIPGAVTGVMFGALFGLMLSARPPSANKPDDPLRAT